MNLSRRQFLGGVAAVALAPRIPSGWEEFPSGTLVAFDKPTAGTTINFKTRFINTGPSTLNINGMRAMMIGRVHEFRAGDIISLSNFGSNKSVLVEIVSTGEEPMSLIDRMIKRFLPKPPDVITPMPKHVSGLYINPSLLGLHMSETDKPGRGLLPSAPKAVVPPL